jgi:hypothetical protein
VKTMDFEELNPSYALPVVEGAVIGDGQANGLELEKLAKPRGCPEAS